MRAWLVVCLAACGDDAAPPPDAAGPGPITLTVVDGTRPIANARVVIQEADHTLVADVRTDAAGTTGAIVNPGAFVTVLDAQARGTLRDVRVFTGVQPGDALVLQLARAVPSLNEPTTSSLTVRLALDPDPAAEHYHVETDCGRTIATAAEAANDITFATTCDGDLELAVISVDVDHKPLHSFYRASIARGATVDLTQATYVPLTNIHYELVNAPSDVEFAVQRSTAKGIEYFTGGTITRATPVTVDVAFPTFPTARETIVGYVGRQLITAWGPTPSSMLDIAEGAMARPSLPRRFPRAIEWPGWSEGPRPDALAASFTISHEGTVIAWRVVSPRADRIALPELPTDLELLMPRDSDAMIASTLDAARASGGYVVLREGLHRMLQLEESGIQGGSPLNIVLNTDSLGTSGTATFETVDVLP